ncbi:MAG: hypothetical protein IID39_03370 [Planctomycetes bacterium]|nr:hypothetical protein [Planctomycetota bacterium]
MKKEQVVWALILLVAGAYLVVRTTGGHMGRAYVKDRVETVMIEMGDRAGEEVQDSRVINTTSNDPDARLSWPRTIGLWAAALFTLCVFSFLYQDNPFYKFAEAVVVGVSAAYWMVVGFWSTIVPNLIGKLWPTLVRNWAMPGLKDPPEYLYFVPLVLGVLLLWRLMPKGGWISRWPMAFFIGAFAGLRMTAYLQSDFVAQIRNTIQDVLDRMPYGELEVGAIIKAMLIIVGVLSGLVYFFFSVEHKGIVGKTARLGIWFLMITFGAGFGYTVMGRIALFAIRVEFLFDDWLWLIDPQLRRVVASAAGA